MEFLQSKAFVDVVRQLEAAIQQLRGNKQVYDVLVTRFGSMVKQISTVRHAWQLKMHLFVSMYEDSSQGNPSVYITQWLNQTDETGVKWITRNVMALVALIDTILEMIQDVNSHGKHCEFPAIIKAQLLSQHAKFIQTGNIEETYPEF